MFLVRARLWIVQSEHLGETNTPQRSSARLQGLRSFSTGQEPITLVFIVEDGAVAECAFYDEAFCSCTWH
eukprot:5035846-Amphidinium_carterae.1